MNAFDKGAHCHDDGGSIKDNPFKPNTDDWQSWRDGFLLHAKNVAMRQSYSKEPICD